VDVTKMSWLGKDPDAMRLSQQLAQVPALRFYGLSLLGDVRAASADVEGARTAYQEAAVIRPTPSITKRLQVTGGWRTTPGAVAPGAVVVAPAVINQPAKPPANPRAVVVQPAERVR